MVVLNTSSLMILRHENGEIYSGCCASLLLCKGQHKPMRSELAMEVRLHNIYYKKFMSEYHTSWSARTFRTRLHRVLYKYPWV